MIQKLGIELEWSNQNDLGYYHLNRRSDYKMFFRVAPLRNVEKTAPYFHDGSSDKLWKAVQLMGKYERGLEISTVDALKIEEFLKSLTGEIPLNYIKKPNKLIN
jgi:cytochrome c peroxidase